jgi:transcriptional regulator with XRE-family HTH domain
VTRRTTEYDIQVGARVREQRERRGLTQANLASGLGVSYQQVQKYETGTNRIPVSRLYKVAQALEVPVTYFFDGIEGPELSLIEEQAVSAKDLTRDIDALQLMREFLRIEKLELRLQIVNMVKEIADAQAKPNVPIASERRQRRSAPKNPSK